MGGARRPSNGAEWLTLRLCEAYELGVLTTQPEAPWASSPLPPTFASSKDLFGCMLQMIRDEAFAMAREGLRARSGGCRLRLEAVLSPKDRGSRLGALSFRLVSRSGGEARGKLLCAGSVLCLTCGNVELLAVVDGRSVSASEEGSFAAVELSQAALTRVSDSLVEHSLWSARPVASVLAQQRCVDACLRQPTPPFFRWLLGAKPSVHIRFDAPAAETAQPPNGHAAAATESPEGDGGRLAALNASQRRVVEAAGTSSSEIVRSGELTLLQGPPGTGKTTTLVHALRALMRGSECDRVLVCAPSNRGVQEVLERVLGALGQRGLASDVGSEDGVGRITALQPCQPLLLPCYLTPQLAQTVTLRVCS